MYFDNELVQARQSIEELYELADAISEEDEFTLELDDDFSTTAADEAEPKEEKATLDDDLGELSFELEDEAPVAKTTASTTAVEDDDFSFDFEESETSLTEDELSFDEAAIDEAAFEETLTQEDVKREERPSRSNDNGCADLFKIRITSFSP